MKAYVPGPHRCCFHTLFSGNLLSQWGNKKGISKYFLFSKCQALEITAVPVLVPGDAPQPGSAIQGTGEVPGVGLSSQSPSAQQNLCSSSEQPKRNKCRNSLGWSGEVYPRSLREAKCETAEALAGTLKQRRIDSSQVPMAKLGYCLDLPVEQGCAALGYRTLFLSWKDAPLLCLPCKMTMNATGT